MCFMAMLKMEVSFWIKADLEWMDVEEGCEKAYSQTPLEFFNYVFFTQDILTFK